MRHAGPTMPRSTNNFPWNRAIPFDPKNPFGTGSLGVLCNSGTIAVPTPATQRYLVSAGNYQPNNVNAVASDTNPIVNPTDLGVGNYWYEDLEKADLLLIRPYLALYSSSAHTAFAAAAAAQGITADLSFFFVKQARPAQANLPMEYTAELKGRVTVTNAATRVPSTTMWLPTGAQWCDAKTVVTDYTILPGILADGEIASGALHLRMDQEGAIGLITYVSGLTANAGAGWLTSHL